MMRPAFLRRAAFLPVLLLLAACDTARAPSFLVMGSYVPSWLVGAFISIPLTLLVRLVFIRLRLDDALPLRLLVYLAIALLFTLAFAFLFSPR